MAGAPDIRPNTLVERLRAGDLLALARAITAVENGTEQASGILGAIHAHLGNAAVIGVTGPPGAGKSTLTSALVTELRRRGKTIGIVAVDPSSPIGGGAILGDRIRMAAHSSDRHVFVRSLASRGHLGGLSRSAARVIDVMDAAGRDIIIVETVGAGQSEVEIAEIAHARIVVLAPGMGDDVQAIKAGILEIADILVVNKSDLPDAENAVRRLESMIALRRPDTPAMPVLATTATTGNGIAELADALDAHIKTLAPGNGKPDPRLRIRRLLAETAARHVLNSINSASAPSIDRLCDRIQRGEIDFQDAVLTALGELSLL
jgi:LAO/AO transport system kinase